MRDTRREPATPAVPGARWKWRNARRRQWEWLLRRTPDMLSVTPADHNHTPGNNATGATDARPTKYDRGRSGGEWPPGQVPNAGKKQSSDCPDCLPKTRRVHEAIAGRLPSQLARPATREPARAGVHEKESGTIGIVYHRAMIMKAYATVEGLNVGIAPPCALRILHWTAVRQLNRISKPVASRPECTRGDAEQA